MHLTNLKYYYQNIDIKIFLTTCFILISSIFFQVNAQQTAQRDANGRGYLEYLPPGYNDNSDQYPVIVFLHGQGERGNGSRSSLEKVKRHGPPKHIKNGHNMCFEYNGVEECFIVLSPQTNGYNFWAPDVMEFIETASQNYRIDPDRIHLMGISMGGQGVWRTAYSEENNDNIFAAISVAPGKGNYEDACKVAEDKTAVWAFHGTEDHSSMPIHAGERPIKGMKACGADPAPIFTVYEGAGHNVWDRAYRTDNSLHSPNIYQWFLAQRREDTNSSNPPTAPSNLSKDFVGTNKIGINWSDDSNNETSFLIERSVNSNRNFNLIESASSNTSHYKDIDLTPNKQYYYRVRAKNKDGYSAYSNTLSVTTDEKISNEPQSSIIIDNSHTSVTKTGRWSVSTAGGYSKFENNYLHDGNNQKGNKKVTFNVNLEPGTYEVYAWWYAYSNRATNTPFEIESDEGVTKIYKNQRHHNAQWVSLGTYQFSSNAIIDISNSNTDGYVVVDALKFNYLETANNEPSPEIILDNRDDGVNTYGNWTSSTAGGSKKYKEDYFHDGNTRKGEKSIAFSATVDPGTYEVFARWYAFSNRASNTPFDIKTALGTETVYKNQKINNAEWVSLGEYDFGNQADIMVRNDNTDGYVVADAIKLVSRGTTTATNTSAVASKMEEPEVVSLDNVVVFPNPVERTFRINSPFDQEKIFHVQMRSKVGAVEWEQSVKGIGEIRFDIDRTYVSPGIKYLSIEVEGQPVKVIKISLL